MEFTILVGIYLIVRDIEVLKMIEKKAPTTTRNSGMKSFFQFGFKKKAKKEKEEVVEEKKKTASMFAEILEKPTAFPKTSRNSTKKQFSFFEEPKNEE